MKVPLEEVLSKARARDVPTEPDGKAHHNGGSLHKGYEHRKEMGLTSARATECINTVSEQLQRDRPYEAMVAGMKFLDLTGIYRLFAALLCAAQQEERST
jgi:hypothetical protein